MIFLNHQTALLIGQQFYGNFHTVSTLFLCPAEPNTVISPIKQELFRVSKEMEETSELFCLVCDTNLEVSSCVNIFYVSLPRNGELLASFVLQVLRCVETDLHSSYVCSRCYNLFQMLEQAQWTVANIRNEILKVYGPSSRKKSLKNEANTGVGVVLENDNKIFIQSFSSEEKLEITKSIDRLRDASYPRSGSGAVSHDIVHKPTVDPLLRPDTKGTSQMGVSLSSNGSKIVEQQSLKANVEGLLAPFGEGSGNNAQCIRVKIEKSSNSGDCRDVPTNKALKETFDRDQTILTQGVKDSLNNKTDNTLTLNRHEKMALYIHQCRMCGRLFKSTNDLESHLVKHGGLRPYKCKKCEGRFPSLAFAKMHATQTHLEEKDVICIASEPCEGEIIDFANGDGIIPEEILRMSDNEEQDDFEWQVADDPMVDTKEKTENVSGSEVEQSFEVDQEISSDSGKVTWKSGRISKYSLKPLKHHCPTCGKKWRTSAELKTHMKSHSSLRPYMCEKCGQAYKHKHALEIHVGMHDGINPFQCTFCNKCFTQKGALMRHLPMHTGETPYQCELCGKRFVHHSSYNMHALSHTGKKSYRCHVCDLSLLSTSHLKRHMRVHTGEKPYSCSLCGKRFAERYNLFAHQKIHDPAEIMAKEAKKTQFKCEQCIALFDKKQKLDDHKKHHHNIATEAVDDKKWVGHTIEVESQQVELPKFYTPHNPNQIQNQTDMKSDVRQNITVGHVWQQLGYSKLQSIDTIPKVSHQQNMLSQIGTNSLTAALDNHRMLMEVSYNKNVLPNYRASSESHASVKGSMI